jgi:hypothetical protein
MFALDLGSHESKSELYLEGGLVEGWKAAGSALAG